MLNLLAAEASGPLLFCFEMRSQDIYHVCDDQVDSKRLGCSDILFPIIRVSQ